jgi:hypothetical protein
LLGTIIVALLAKSPETRRFQIRPCNYFEAPYRMSARIFITYRIDFRNVAQAINFGLHIRNLSGLAKQ